MTHEFFGSGDWSQNEFVATAGAGGSTRVDNAPFNEALARLFHAANEAGAPPHYLRAMLAVERWSTNGINPDPIALSLSKGGRSP